MRDLNFKIYRAVYGGSEHMASAKNAEDAAMLVSNLGPESFVQYVDGRSRWMIWKEGDDEGQDGRAGFSYDEAAKVMWSRINERAENLAEFLRLLKEERAEERLATS